MEDLINKIENLGPREGTLFLCGQYYDELIKVDDLESRIAQTIKIANLKSSQSKVNAEIAVYVRKADIFSDQFISNCTKISTAVGEFKHSFLVDEDCKFTPEEWVKLKEINEELKKSGIQFGFEDYGNKWSVEQVEAANTKISKTVEEINENPLSPIEKLMYAYMTVTGRKYTREEGSEHISESRSIYGVLNSEKVVCVGYSAWLKSIISELGDENIKIFENEVMAHQNIVIHINDSKYGLNGYYMMDPCWDAVELKGEINLNHFLIPIKDLNKQNTINLANSTTPRHLYYGLSTPRKSSKMSLGADTVFANEELWNVAIEEDNNLSRERTTELEFRENNANNEVESLSVTKTNSLLAGIAAYLAYHFTEMFNSINKCPLMDISDISALNKALYKLSKAQPQNDIWLTESLMNEENLTNLLLSENEISNIVNKYKDYSFEDVVQNKIDKLPEDNKLREKFYKLKNSSQLNEYSFDTSELKALGLVNVIYASEYFSTKVTNMEIKREERERLEFIRENERKVSKNIANTTTKRTKPYQRPTRTLGDEDSIVSRGKNSAVLYSHMEEHSKPVGLEVISNSLVNVLAAKNLKTVEEEIKEDLIAKMREEGLSEAEIINKIEESEKEIKNQAIRKIEEIAENIIDSNVNRSSRCFSADAQNAFVVEAVSCGQYVPYNAL